MRVDVDGFKEIKDRRGHAAGDEVIRRVWGRFCARSIDIAPLQAGTTDCEAWIARADKALCRVRRGGRDGVAVCPEETSSIAMLKA